jgi:hypothetical protein
MKSDVQRTAQLVQANNGTKLAFAKNDREKEELWYSRKVALWSALDYCACSLIFKTWLKSSRRWLAVYRHRRLR